VSTRIIELNLFIKAVVFNKSLDNTVGVKQKILMRDHPACDGDAMMMSTILGCASSRKIVLIAIFCRGIRSTLYVVRSTSYVVPRVVLRTVLYARWQNYIRLNRLNVL
jgi:hypothetical protein